MTTKKGTKRALLTSVLALLLCMSMLVGTTFAWFTDSVTSGVNTIVSGNLDINVYYATPADVVDGDIPEDSWKPVTADESLFNKDALWEPGYTEAVFLKFVNEGTLALEYQLQIDILSETLGKTKDGADIQLSNYIQAYACNAFTWNYKDYLFTDRNDATNPVGAPDPFHDSLYNAANGEVATPSGDNPLSLDSWQWLDPTETTYATLVLWMPTTVGNEANHDGENIPKIDLGISVIATQYNWEKDSFDENYDVDAEYPVLTKAWDGTADTSWYNETDTEFTLSSAEQLAGLAELVNEGNTFMGKTIKLDADLDLYAEDEDGNRINFDPIGHSQNGQSFNGTFDGQGNTIQNLYIQNDLGAWQYEGEYYSLFAYTNGAVIKNLTIADAYISSGRNEAAGVVGNAVDTTFSDITISNTTLIAYNNSAGGVASECYGSCSFTNITVDEDTVIGPLWGTYDVRLGGVVGMVQSSDNVTFSNITIACQLDAINDVASNYQWYNYRYSGMLIGQVGGVNGVADPTGYVTCENVTVIYGDWVNYHYCEDSSYGTPSYASEGEYKFNRVEAGTGTNGIDLSTCDHDENETHNLLIVFDQLFGGGQGVSGLKTYNGVTVVYPNN